MNYTQSITRRHRTAFVLAIDQSGSMVEELEFRGRRTSKAAAVAEVANSLLSELLLRATREGEVRDYYDIAVVGYSGEGVHSLLSADETFVPVSALRNAVRNTRRVSVERRLPDGQPAFNEVTVSEWIAPAASGQTPMYEALLYVHDLVEAWCRRPEHRESFPPLVFNITDGEASDSDEEELAQIAGRIRSLMAKKLSWRVAPELRFHLDESVDNAQRIAEALSADAARNASARAEDPAEG